MPAWTVDFEVSVGFDRLIGSTFLAAALASGQAACKSDATVTVF